MTGLVWLDATYPDGSKIELVAQDKSDGWIVIDGSKISETGGVRSIVVSFVSFGRVAPAGFSPIVDIRIKPAFFVSPTGSGTFGTPDAPGQWDLTVVSHRDDAWPCAILFQSGNYATNGSTAYSFVSGNVAMYGGFDGNDWLIRNERSSLFSSVAPAEATTLYFGDMSSNASVTIDGFTVLSKTAGVSDNGAIVGSTSGEVVIHDCSIGPDSPNATSFNLTGVSLSNANAAGSFYLINNDISAGSTSKTSGATATRGLNINSNQLTAKYFIYGCRIDGGTSISTDPSTNAARSEGVSLQGEGRFYVVGNIIWGGVSHRAVSDNAYSYGIYAGALNGPAWFVSNLVCGGRSTGTGGASAHVYGIYLSASQNTGIAHMNTIYSGTTNDPAEIDPYAVWYSISTAVAHGFSGNIVIANDDGASSMAIYNFSPISSFDPFSYNAIWGRQDGYQIGLGQNNHFSSDWAPSGALARFSNDTFITASEFIAADFHIAAGDPGLLGSIASADASLAQYKNEAATQGFQFAFFDAAGVERPLSGNWTLGAFQ